MKHTSRTYVNVRIVTKIGTISVRIVTKIGTTGVRIGTITPSTCSSSSTQVSELVMMKRGFLNLSGFPASRITERQRLNLIPCTLVTPTGERFELS